MSHYENEIPPPPYVPPPSEAPPKEVIALTWSAPPRGLGLGWRDLTANPGVSLFYGLAFWVMALLLGVPLLGHATWHAYRGSVRWL